MIQNTEAGSSHVVLGIDIGVIHLALVLIRVDLPGWGASTLDRSPTLTVLNACLVNLMSSSLGHEHCSRTQCRLYHSNMSCDRVDHLVQACAVDFFDPSELIVVELQPLGGMRDIEQLLVKLYRHKIRLVSPNRIHKWLGLTGLSYSVRKERQERAAVERGFSCQGTHQENGTCSVPCLLHGTGLTTLYVPPNEQRYHDFADAYLLVLYMALHPTVTFTESAVMERGVEEEEEGNKAEASIEMFTIEASSEETLDVPMNDQERAEEDLSREEPERQIPEPTGALPSDVMRFLDSFRYQGPATRTKILKK